MPSPIKVIIGDIHYSPAPSADGSDDGSADQCDIKNRIKPALNRLYYLIYFDHWHRKNGPVSECLSTLFPELDGLLGDGEYELIKAKVSHPHKTQKQDGLSRLTVADSDHDVTIDGVKYVPSYLINRYAGEAIAEAVHLLCDVYMSESRTKTPALESKVMRVFELLAPDIHAKIASGKLGLAYELLDD